MIRALSPILSIVYLLLAHLASIFGQPGFALVAGIVLVLLVLMQPLRRARAWAWLALGGATALVFALARLELAMLPLYAPPVLFNLFFAWLFGRTLARGSRSLIERIARLLEPADGPLDPDVQRYCRRLTAGWTFVFLALATINLVLALFAVPDGLLASAGVTTAINVPQALWSWFANVINYLVVGVFFVAEYFWRRHRFPAMPWRTFRAFCRRMASLPAGVWRTLAQ